MNRKIRLVNSVEFVFSLSSRHFRSEVVAAYGSVEWIVHLFELVFNFISFSTQVFTRIIFPMSSHRSPLDPHARQIEKFATRKSFAIAASEWMALIFAHQRDMDFILYASWSLLWWDVPLQRGAKAHSTRKHMCLPGWLHGKVYALNKLCSLDLQQTVERHFDVSQNVHRQLNAWLRRPSCAQWSAITWNMFAEVRLKVNKFVWKSDMK